MREWRRLHPEKVRGLRVHMTLEEKKDVAKDYEKESAEFLMRTVERLEKETFQMQKLRSVKTKYLLPKVENFIETEEVKKIKEKVKLWLNAGYPVHIIGPTGCGKSTLALRAAEELGRPIVWVNGDETMTTADLVGGYSEIEAESLRDRYIHTVLKTRDVMRAGWVDNPLTVACKYGYTFIYNDFSRSRPEANNILLSVFQEGILELPKRFGEERYIKVDPKFRAILTSNSVDYVGVFRPQDALLDRTVGIYMDFYDFYTEVEIVKAHSGISQGEAEAIVDAIRRLREKLPDAEKPGTRACIMIAKRLAVGGGQIEELLEELCLDILATKSRGPTDWAAKQKLIKEILATKVVKNE
jgi:nitric oxide reductase NorQ protein